MEIHPLHSLRAWSLQFVFPYEKSDFYKHYLKEIEQMFSTMLFKYVTVSKT